MYTEGNLLSKVFSNKYQDIMIWHQPQNKTIRSKCPNSFSTYSILEHFSLHSEHKESNSFSVQRKKLWRSYACQPWWKTEVKSWIIMREKCPKQQCKIYASASIHCGCYPKTRLPQPSWTWACQSYGIPWLKASSVTSYKWHTHTRKMSQSAAKEQHSHLQTCIKDVVVSSKRKTQTLPKFMYACLKAP